MLLALCTMLIGCYQHTDTDESKGTLACTGNFICTTDDGRIFNLSEGTPSVVNYEGEWNCKCDSTFILIEE